MSWMFSEARISRARSFMAPQSTTPMRPTSRARRMAHEDVLGHGQLGVEAQLLVHRGDASGLCLVRAVEGDLLAVHADGARVRPVDAGDDLDERGLAGAVLAHQGVDLAGGDREVHVLQRPDARELLADALELEQRCHAVLAHSSCVPSSPSGPRRPARPCAAAYLTNVGAGRCIRLHALARPSAARALGPRERRDLRPRRLPPGPAASWRDGWPSPPPARWRPRRRLRRAWPVARRTPRPASRP